MARKSYIVYVPTRNVTETINVPERLIWWNTFYGHRHEFEGGRIEVRSFPSAKAILSNQSFSCRCPYCPVSVTISPQSLLSRHGEVVCGGCKGRFALNPRGQMIVVLDSPRRVNKRVVDSKPLEWLRNESGYRGWHLEPVAVGVRVTTQDNAAELEQMLYEHRLRYEED